MRCGGTNKCWPLSRLVPYVEYLKRGGKTIVFTNGCFDLFHAGHLAVLKVAAEMGDLLVVGINSDASVRRLKGPDRPVVPESERAAIVAALAVVDYVLVFDEDTPLGLLEALKPHVLVKGPTAGPIVGADYIRRLGGRVVCVPAVPGVSTTDRLRAIRQGLSISHSQLSIPMEDAQV